jgi:hypothetical protein
MNDLKLNCGVFNWTSPLIGTALAIAGVAAFRLLTPVISKIASQAMRHVESCFQRFRIIRAPSAPVFPRLVILLNRMPLEALSLTYRADGTLYEEPYFMPPDPSQSDLAILDGLFGQIDKLLAVFDPATQKKLDAKLVSMRPLSSVSGPLYVIEKTAANTVGAAFISNPGYLPSQGNQERVAALEINESSYGLLVRFHEEEVVEIMGLKRGKNEKFDPKYLSYESTLQAISIFVKHSEQFRKQAFG